MSNQKAYSLFDFKGALFDLDGVITNTAHLHAASWKQMFDAFLKHYEARHGEKIEPFSVEEDYPEYIDGKPRYDGVRAFLRGRGIHLPEGNSDDSPGELTIQGIGNQKNEIFRDLLSEEPVEVYQTNVHKIIEWRKAGIQTAVISSSKNCAAILEVTNLNFLFDVRIDGVIAERRQLWGKPEPDIFLAGAQALGLSPSECIVFEDAISGVQAGNDGDFGLVIGLTTTNQETTLIKNGADMAVKDFQELDAALIQPKHKFEKLQSALRKASLDKMSQNPVLFIDYDGTLTPIVNNPDEALLSDQMRQTLYELGQQIPVAIISGRDRAQVEAFVGLDNLYYAGSHGYDISGPGGLHMELDQALNILPDLDTAEAALREETSGLQGIQIERKRFAIAIHYRNASSSILNTLKPIVDQIARPYNNLHLSGGKQILELKPNFDWDKGKAMQWLFQKLNVQDPAYTPIYLGDDLTDEDAFRPLINKGIGILVGDHGYRTFAQYHLANTKEVEQFLKQLKIQLTEEYA